MESRRVRTHFLPGRAWMADSITIPNSLRASKDAGKLCAQRKVNEQIFSLKPYRTIRGDSITIGALRWGSFQSGYSFYSWDSWRAPEWIRSCLALSLPRTDRLWLR